MLSQDWGVTWRKGLLSLPRLVPDLALRVTSPEGPQPIVIKIPSRGSHLIPLYVFIPLAKLKEPSSQSHAKTSRFPVLVDFHGGGFVYGSCQEQAPFCAKLSRELNCVAVSVDYRLGPAAQFPSATDDGEDVLRAILDPAAAGHEELRKQINDYSVRNLGVKVEFETNQVALSGFSSGGNIALNMVMSMAPPEVSKEWPSPFATDYKPHIPTILFYPSVDTRKLPSERERPPKMGQAPKGFLQSLELEDRLQPTYLPRDKTSHPRASPGLADVNDLHPRAKVLLILAELDTLTKQNETWVQKLTAAGRGGDVVKEIYPGVLHGWTQFPDPWIDERGRELKLKAQNKAVEFIRTCWS